MTSTREKQLGFFKDNLVIKQDQELIDLIKNHSYTNALAVGDVEYFSQFIKFVNQGPVDFCIYIQNNKFDFDDLISDINSIIDSHMNRGGLIYLSLNKYLVNPRCYDRSLPIDYDRAIEEYVKKQVRAKVENYIPCGIDGGNQFNWVHPLTRFHLRVLY